MKGFSLLSCHPGGDDCMSGDRGSKAIYSELGSGFKSVFIFYQT